MVLQSQHPQASRLRHRKTDSYVNLDGYTYRCEATKRQTHQAAIHPTIVDSAWIQQCAEIHKRNWDACKDAQEIGQCQVKHLTGEHLSCGRV